MPVIWSAADEHRKATVPPSCAGEAKSRDGCFSARSSSVASFWLMPRCGRDVADLLFHQRRPHPAGADRIAGHAAAGGLEADHLGQADQPVLGRDIGGLVRRSDEAVRGGDVDDPSPALLFHLRHRGGDAVERGRQIDRQDCVPLGGREFLHRRGELDAGIVDEDVEPSELFDRRLDQSAHGVALRHVGAVIDDAHAVVALDAAADRLDLARRRQSRSARCRRPSFASSLAIPSPMPLVDPVTMATLPFNM